MPMEPPQKFERTLLKSSNIFVLLLLVGVMLLSLTFLVGVNDSVIFSSSLTEVFNNYHTLIVVIALLLGALIGLGVLLNALRIWLWEKQARRE